jgi:outer membrane protein assembly factor BamB
MAAAALIVIASVRIWPATGTHIRQKPRSLETAANRFCAGSLIPSDPTPDRTELSSNLFAEPGYVGLCLLPRMSVYFVTGKQQLVRYDLAAGAATLHAGLPPLSLGTLRLFLTGSQLIGADAVSVFAFDPETSAVKWRYAAEKDQRFVMSLPAARGFFVLCDNGALLEFDPSTGKTAHRHQTLWPSSNILISGDTLYAFTFDNHAYAMNLKK